MRRLIPFVALGTLLGPAAGCRSTTVHDVTRAFAKGEQELVLRVPSRAEPNPALAVAPEPAMAAAVETAKAYLKEAKYDNAKSRFARALYACSLLARGETARAQRIMQGIQPQRDSNLSRERRIVYATVYAAGACRALNARERFVAVCAGEADLEDWVEEYGSFAGIDLPDPEAESYDELLARGVEQIRARCLPVDPEDEREMARIERGRAEVRRAIGEHMYNEAAAMLVMLKRPGDDNVAAAERWLATVTVGFFIVYAQVIPDLLPAKLNREQKRWQRRQAMSVYDRLRRVCDWFIPTDEREEIVPTSIARTVEDRDEFYRYLYARLLDAEVTVIGWITTR